MSGTAADRAFQRLIEDSGDRVLVDEDFDGRRWLRYAIATSSILPRHHVGFAGGRGPSPPRWGGPDSLDILDDIATAVLAFEAQQRGVLLEAVAGRAAAIVRHATDNAPELRVPWGLGANRPALRALARLSRYQEIIGLRQASIATAELLLRLNPGDNHGMRGPVVNERLRAGDDEGALSLCDCYPDDFLADCVFGAALALFRLDRRAEAEARLARTLLQRTKVPAYLERERARAPEPSPHGIRLGGDYEAWLYRHEMRAAWQSTPGAIPWLVATCRAIARRTRAAHHEDRADDAPA